MYISHTRRPSVLCLIFSITESSHVNYILHLHFAKSHRKRLLHLHLIYDDAVGQLKKFSKLISEVLRLPYKL